ncbi:EAL domain-containing protein [Oscillatoria sp. FACHB-1406]|uniref:putative bifunctional diguanylate cyclase/phosphodiesterase n=1 Tax=Oscillatoria sp. FACHB-1406 TaxID=2692846 RepID=UPI0016891D73|nr:EAL domain-containing protein [Oscillatoria sp. FACHB-1406]MBD2576962.1 EAL domain-containing protein [Oscillatoria sp. FACHB-1406]
MRAIGDVTGARSKQKSYRPLEGQPSAATPATISYELRTPLTSIQGALGLLLSGKIDINSEKSQRLLAIAANNVDRLLRLLAALEKDKCTAMPVLSVADLERLRLAADFYSALERNEFQLYYQPVVCAKAGRIMGFEALLRWYNPRRGFISPQEFIPIAEETRAIDRLGLWVLRQACRQLRQWQDEFPGYPPLTVSVNLSPVQLLQPNLSQQIQRVCQETGIAPGSLRIEVTESVLIENSEAAIARLRELKATGIQLYLDDFGTGYSSLSRLYELSIDVLKIDRSFVRGKQWGMIRGIIHLASGMGLGVIAEGVETIEELAQLKALGCNLLQGYLFSKPVDAKRAGDLIARGCEAVSRERDWLPYALPVAG